MNAQELFTAGGKSAGVWYCESCNVIHRNKSHADSCCVCTYCGKPFDRKEEYSSGHKSCWSERTAKVDYERLEKAELVTDYDGPLYSIQGWGTDGFIFGDAEEVLCDAIESPEDWPEFLHCCKPVGLRRIDSSWIVEQLTDDFGEDADEHVTVPPSLDAALDEFYEANKDLKWYDPDYSRKVRAPEMPEELRAELTT